MDETERPLAQCDAARAETQELRLAAEAMVAALEEVYLDGHPTDTEAVRDAQAELRAALALGQASPARPGGIRRIG